jgi:radical SAM protein with 4Fe4S-binding SPASM domain
MHNVNTFAVMNSLNVLKSRIGRQTGNLLKPRNIKKYHEREYKKALNRQRRAKLVVEKCPNIAVEINNTCNLDCLMCSTKRATRAKGNMPVSLFERIVTDILKPLNRKSVVLHTVGEPLMHPEFDHILRILRKEGIKLVLTTNALLADRYLASFYDNREVFSRINVSIDGACKSTYEEVRRGGDFDRLIQNLELLYTFSQKGFYKIPLSLQCAVNKKNINEIPLFYRVFGKYFQSNLCFACMTSIGAVRDDPVFFREFNILPGNTVERFAPCKLPGCAVYILIDGRISACCRDYNGELIMGDINSEEVMSVWNSHRYAELRRLHRERRTSQIPLCRDCYTFPIEVRLAFKHYIQYLFSRYDKEDDGFYTDKIRGFLSIMEMAAVYKDWRLLETFLD